MAGRIFEQLPHEYVEILIDKNPDGGRFRTPPVNSKHNPIYTGKRDSLICKMRLNGNKISEIAEAVNLHIRTVRKILRKNNICMPYENEKKNREEQIRELIISGYSKKGLIEERIA